MCSQGQPGQASLTVSQFYASFRWLRYSYIHRPTTFTWEYNFIFNIIHFNNIVAAESSVLAYAYLEDSEASEITKFHTNRFRAVNLLR